MPIYRGYQNPQQMGFDVGEWFRKRLGLPDIDILGPIHDAVGRLGDELGKAFANIDWAHIGRELASYGRWASHILLVELNPVHLIWQGLKTFPLTDHLAMELDHLTGGAITRVEAITTLAGRALQGDAISEQELIKDALFAAKVAAVIISGGTAAGIITATSDQMKKGTLGETELGRAILDIATVGGLAYVGSGNVLTEIERQAVRSGMASGQNEIIKHSELGQTQLGRDLIAVAFSGATAGLTGGDIGGTMIGTTKNTAADRTATEISKQTGIPVSSDMVKSVAEAGYPPDYTKIDFGALSRSTGKSQFELFQMIERINLDFTLKLPTIDLTGTDDAGKKLITSNEVDWTQQHIQPISVAGSAVTVPNPATESGMQEIINYWYLIKYLMYRNGKRALYKTPYTINGQNYMAYMLEDGSFYFELIESIILWLILLAAAGGVVYYART